MTSDSLTAVSLFCSGGIGDLAVRAAGIQTIVANELLPDRAGLFSGNFPEARMVVGDIRQRQAEIVTTAREALKGRVLDFVFATPPCQGMSKNGRGKLLQGVRSGDKPSLDERNQLIIPTIEIVKALAPGTVVIENVPEMARTLIQAPSGGLIDMFDYLAGELGGCGYVGASRVIEFADYGVPQRRQRLITVFSKVPSICAALYADNWFPPATHAKAPDRRLASWISVQEAIGHLPSLDAASAALATSSLPLHYVPVLDADKYFWVSNTPPGRGAFDNQCVNPRCRFDGNVTHGAAASKAGVNKAKKDTPIRCHECGELLPRPWVRTGGDVRLMSGFTSAYKRMRGDLPASALTRNLSYACSDQKLHPTQNRVLSLLEACIIHTIDRYDYCWKATGRTKISDKTIREVIGESIPPLGLEILFRHLARIASREKLAA